MGKSIFTSLIGGFLAMGAVSVQAQVFLNYSVNQPAILQAQAGADQLICLGQTATLGGSPTANGGNGGYAYLWAGAALSSAVVANPSASPVVTTSYLLTVSDASNCTAFDTMVVAVDTCIGLHDIPGLSAFEVFPNPNDGKFTVEARFTESQESLRLTIFDESGKLVYERRYADAGLTFKQQLSLLDLAKGAYHVRLESAGKLVSRKMILQ